MTFSSEPTPSANEVCQSRIDQMSPYFDVQEFQCTSRSSSDSFEDVLPAIDVMSICTQLSTQPSTSRAAKRRVHFTLMPSVFGADGSSSPQVTSWNYKPVRYVNNTENASKRRGMNMNKKNDRDEWSLAREHSQRVGYSSPAFRCRSPPSRLHKNRNAQNKAEQTSSQTGAVSEMTIQRAILFQRTLNSKFITNDERRKHNNTPICDLEPEILKLPLKKHVSMPDLKSLHSTLNSGGERKDRQQYILRKTYKNVSTREKTQALIVPDVENNITVGKCPYCIAESQSFGNTKDVIKFKKIDIKLPCLDTNQDP